jgi:hypothetical protein
MGRRLPIVLADVAGIIVVARGTLHRLFAATTMLCSMYVVLRSNYSILSTE